MAYWLSLQGAWVAESRQSWRTPIWYLHLSQAVFWRSCRTACSHQTSRCLLGGAIMCPVIQWHGVNDRRVSPGEGSSRATVNVSWNNWFRSARWLATCWSNLGPSWISGVDGEVGALVIFWMDCWGIRGMVDPTWIPGRRCTRLEITLSALVRYWGKNRTIILSQCGRKLTA